MIHIETLSKFNERLPAACDNRGKTKCFTVDKEWDTDTPYKQKNVPVKFTSTYIEKMDCWKWVYEGEVMI